MKKLKFLVGLCLLMSFQIAQAQTEDSVINYSTRQVFFADWTFANTPTGGGFGVNFDKRFKYASNNGLGFRVGINFGKEKYYNTAYNGVQLLYRKVNILFPLCLNYMTGKKSSHFIVEAGFVPYLKEQRNISQYNAFCIQKTQLKAYGSFLLGYRYTAPGDGLMAQIIVNPIYLISGDPKDLITSNIASIGIGYTFLRW